MFCAVYGFCFKLHGEFPTRPTLIFQGVGVSLTLTQRVPTSAKDALQVIYEVSLTDDSGACAVHVELDFPNQSPKDQSYLVSRLYEAIEAYCISKFGRDFYRINNETGWRDYPGLYELSKVNGGIIDVRLKHYLDQVATDGDYSYMVINYEFDNIEACNRVRGALHKDNQFKELERLIKERDQLIRK